MGHIVRASRLLKHNVQKLLTENDEEESGAGLNEISYCQNNVPVVVFQDSFVEDHVVVSETGKQSCLFWTGNGNFVRIWNVFTQRVFRNMTLKTL